MTEKNDQLCKILCNMGHFRRPRVRRQSTSTVACRSQLYAKIPNPRVLARVLARVLGWPSPDTLKRGMLRSRFTERNLGPISSRWSTVSVPYDLPIPQFTSPLPSDPFISTTSNRLLTTFHPPRTSRTAQGWVVGCRHPPAAPPAFHRTNPCCDLTVCTSVTALTGTSYRYRQLAL